MIDFEEELKKFKPAPQVDEAEKIIRENVMTDLKDVIVSVAQNSGNETKMEQQKR